MNALHGIINLTFYHKISTTVILPTSEDRKAKAYFSLSHQGGESFTKIQPLFPYTWHGEW